MLLLGTGCTYSVDDGQWTYAWRAEGRELRDTAYLRGTCADWADGKGAARAPAHQSSAHLRSRVHDRNGGGALRCDEHIAFVSAQCEPRTHEETWSPALFR